VISGDVALDIVSDVGIAAGDVMNEVDRTTSGV
jgi:hypothetical protein